MVVPSIHMCQSWEKKNKHLYPLDTKYWNLQSSDEIQEKELLNVLWRQEVDRTTLANTTPAETKKTRKAIDGLKVPARKATARNYKNNQMRSKY